MNAIEQNPSRVSGRTVALVTGANKGIGYAVAKGLGDLGFVVLVGARDAQRAHEAVARLGADGVSARAVVVDITDDESVAAAATTIRSRFGRLDVLVNNAAVKFEFHPSPPSVTPIEVVRQTYETNVFGTMRVMQAMLPLLREAPSPRIVNVSSGLGSLGYAADPSTIYARKPLLGYSTAKAALNSMTLQFANELRETPIKINACDPGYVRTDMTHNDGSRRPEQAAMLIVRLATLPDDGPSGGFFDEKGPIPW